MLAKGSFIDSSRYRIDALISSGASSEIYRAFDRILNQDVVVKVFERADNSFPRTTGSTSKLARQVKAFSHLSHPGIETVYKCGYLEEEGKLFVVEELLEGQTLRARVNREGGLKCNETIKIALEIAFALEYAHAHAVLHLDLRPESVMLISTESGDRAKLLGFGQITGEPALDQGTTDPDAQIRKSLAFKSPEQCKKGECDERSDIYSFGCLLFYMLTGTPPFDSLLLGDLVMAHLHKRVPKIQALSPKCGLPRELDQIILRCTAKDKQARYKSFSELIPDLLAIDEMNCQSRFMNEGAKLARTGSAIYVLMALLALTAAFFACQRSGLFDNFETVWGKQVARDLPGLSACTRRLVHGGKLQPAVQVLESGLQSDAFHSAGAVAKADFLQEQKHLFQSSGDNRASLSLSLKLLQALLEDASTNIQSKTQMNEIWQLRARELCRDFTSSRLPSKAWGRINWLLSDVRYRGVKAVAGDAAIDLVELAGLSDMKMNLVPGELDRKHASASFMDAALMAKRAHDQRLFCKEINLALDACKEGDVNQNAQRLHLIIAEEALEKNRPAEALKELNLSRELAAGVMTSAEDESRRKDLADKLIKR